jgi:hypothetical protein
VKVFFFKIVGKSDVWKICKHKSVPNMKYCNNEMKDVKVFFFKTVGKQDVWKICKHKPIPNMKYCNNAIS